MRHSCASMPRDNKTTGRSIMADAMRNSMAPAHGSSPSHSPTALALQGFAPETAGFAPPGPGRDSIFRVFYRTWNLLEKRHRSRKLPEAKNAGKSGVFRQAEAILRSGRRGSKKITVLSGFGENFAFWRENQREKREKALPENASAVGQNKMR